MQGFFSNLLFVFFSLFVPSHIVLLDLFDKLNLRVVPVQDEFLVVGLRVQDSVDVLEGGLEVLVLEQFLLGFRGQGDGVFVSRLQQLFLLGLDLLLLLL